MKLLHCDAPTCETSTPTGPDDTPRSTTHDWHVVMGFPHRGEPMTWHVCSPACVIALVRDVNPGLFATHRPEAAPPSPRCGNCGGDLTPRSFPGAPNFTAACVDCGTRHGVRA